MSRARTRVRLELGPKSHVKVRKKENGNSIRSTVVASCCCTYVLSPSLSFEYTHTLSLSLSHTRTNTQPVSFTHTRADYIYLTITQPFNLSGYCVNYKTSVGKNWQVHQSHMQRAKSYRLIYLGRHMNKGTP